MTKNNIYEVPKFPKVTKAPRFVVFFREMQSGIDEVPMVPKVRKFKTFF